MLLKNSDSKPKRIGPHPPIWRRSYTRAISERLNPYTLSGKPRSKSAGPIIKTAGIWAQ
jgi:hypothetical protein